MQIEPLVASPGAKDSPKIDYMYMFRDVPVAIAASRARSLVSRAVKKMEVSEKGLSISCLHGIGATSQSCNGVPSSAHVKFQA